MSRILYGREMLRALGWLRGQLIYLTFGACTPRLKTPLINCDGEVYRNAASTTSFPSMKMIMNSQSGLASDQWDRKGTAKSSGCTRSGEIEEA